MVRPPAPCPPSSLQIRTIDRVCEIPHEGPFCDLMWSDPEDIETWAVSPRGAGWLFGRKVTSEFNQINGACGAMCFVADCCAAYVRPECMVEATVDFGAVQKLADVRLRGFRGFALTAAVQSARSVLA